MNILLPLSLSDGDIVANTDLHTDPEAAYILEVKVTDKYNPEGVTKELIIELLGKYDLHCFILL